MLKTQTHIHRFTEQNQNVSVGIRGEQKVGHHLKLACMCQSQIKVG